MEVRQQKKSFIYGLISSFLQRSSITSVVWPYGTRFRRTHALHRAHVQPVTRSPQDTHAFATTRATLIERGFRKAHAAHRHMPQVTRSSIGRALLSNAPRLPAMLADKKRPDGKVRNRIRRIPRNDFRMANDAETARHRHAPRSVSAHNARISEKRRKIAEFRSFLPL